MEQGVLLNMKLVALTQSNVSLKKKKKKKLNKSYHNYSCINAPTLDSKSRGFVLYNIAKF